MKSYQLNKNSFNKALNIFSLKEYFENACCYLNFITYIYYSFFMFNLKVKKVNKIIAIQKIKCNFFQVNRTK